MFDEDGFPTVLFCFIVLIGFFLIGFCIIAVTIKYNNELKNDKVCQDRGGRLFGPKTSGFICIKKDSIIMED